MRVILAGATGFVGGRLLQHLLADPACEGVIALGRRPLPFVHPKLEARIVDLAALAPIAGGQAFCCLGTTIRTAGSQAAFRAVDHDHVVAFARAARQGGATRFHLLSSVGADPQASNFYLRVKGETENDVAALGFPGLDIYRPSLLLGPRAEFRLGEAVARTVMPLISPVLPAKYRAIDRDVVARAMAAATKLAPTSRQVHHFTELRQLAGG
jgi:uncharacterized protein YbjT (DUF2867 family)